MEKNNHGKAVLILHILPPFCFICFGIFLWLYNNSLDQLMMMLAIAIFLGMGSLYGYMKKSENLIVRSLGYIGIILNVVIFIAFIVFKFNKT